MQKLSALFTIALAASGMHAIAQNITSGEIIYEEVMQLDIKIEGEMAAMMPDLPKEQKSNKVLYFNEKASLFTAVKENEEDESGFSAGGGMHIMMKAPENEVYIDLKDEEVIEKREFMTRMFLIESGFPELGWKITGKQKMILDYPCMEAERTDTAGIVTKAWFAPSIPVSSGPSRYCNLPGMVLGVDIDNGKHTFTATSISPGEEFADEIKKPREGKKVSQEEFDGIVAEKMKEMGIENGGAGSGSGNIIIRIHQ